jgi:heptosyltransferase-2
LTEPAAAPTGGRTAVIVGHPGMGDMVWHLPAMQAIARHHGAPISLFARASTQSKVLFARTPEIGEVIGFERKQGRDYLPALFDLAAKLRRGRFQRVYVLNRRPMLALATRLAGVPERYGFGAPPQRWLLNRGAWLYDGRDVVGGGPVVHCQRFLARNGITLTSVTPEIEADPLARDLARARFADAPRPWIALAVTVNDEPRRWPGASFADLALRLRALTGGTVFLHGGPHHAYQADDVIRHLSADTPHILNLSRQTMEFVEVMALLAESDLFVGNDSGPLNVAAALGVPAYGLFGNAAPHESLSPRIRPILPATGVPDLETGMKRLTVDHVMASIVDVLASSNVSASGSNSTPIQAKI